MGTSGVKAYLYKKRYFTTYIPNSSHPHTFGDWFARQIPREEHDRLVWITSLIEQIEEEVRWRNERGIPDEERLDLKYLWGKVENGFTVLYEGRPMVFQEIKGIEEGMVPDDFDNEWSYVIDLDNRAFTINGRMHFRLDNMPPGSIDRYFWRVPNPENPGYTCIPTFAHPPSTPAEYIATVSRWPFPNFDISRTHNEYKTLGSVLLSIEEWGAPTWTSLTAAQQLSENLVQTLLRDSAETLSNPDLARKRPTFGVCLWQLFSAAAPSHLCCPPDPGLSASKSSRDTFIRPIEEVRKSGYPSCITPHYLDLDLEPVYVDHHTSRLEHKYYWFRGCLVVFCPRLDDTEYVEHRTILMVQNLRKYGRTTGIGLIFSGRQVLAVAVDGKTVRCSPPLLFHDAKMNIQDGFLLVTHLLSPYLVANKMPWMQNLSTRLAISGVPRLPHELVRKIVFQLDYDDYHNLAQVSRSFRKIYATYPHVAGYIVLGYAGNGSYHVLQTSTEDVQILYLQRFAPFDDYYENLVYAFQHVSRGPHNLRPSHSKSLLCYIGEAETEYATMLNRGVYYEENGGWSKIHLQAVHGIWDFVAPEEAESNFPGEVESDEARDSDPRQGTWS
ncbi:hypothetical protein FRC12_015771 [Ceratobasidium sp. 428]|nr:hypothetical protein FRC12_015771 [Ceratobasidium sp. 428]